MGVLSEWSWWAGPKLLHFAGCILNSFQSWLFAYKAHLLSLHISVIFEPSTWWPLPPRSWKRCMPIPWAHAPWRVPGWKPHWWLSAGDLRPASPVNRQMALPFWTSGHSPGERRRGWCRGTASNPRAHPSPPHCSPANSPDKQTIIMRTKVMWKRLITFFRHSVEIWEIAYKAKSISGRHG